MSDQSTPAAVALAEKLLANLLDSQGASWVEAVLNIVEGQSLDQTLEDLSIMGRAVLQAIVGVLEPAAVRAAIKAGYAAANAAGDAALNDKFPKG